MRRLLFALAAALVLASCGDSGAGDLDHDWLHVLHHKKAASAPNASTRARQVYADSLGAFVQQHPQHSRARAVYERIQLDFARELASVGRYQDSIRFYRAVLAHDPQSHEATAGIADAVDHLAVPRHKLLALEKGMSEHQVAQMLGKPIPGWKARTDRGETVIDSWYYRTTEGGVAGVYFRDGVLFAAEAASHARLSPLTHQ
jgi:hypothetical protein